MEKAKVLETIKAAGETNITVKQAGNATYAVFTKTQKSFD